MAFDRKVLLDTSVMVDLLRGVERARYWIDGIAPKCRFLSFITVAELIAGCRNRDEQNKIERELKEYVLLYLDTQSCKHGVEWYKKFHLSHRVGFLDCLMAATAYKKSIPIATLNDKHFKLISGISVIRPY